MNKPESGEEKRVNEKNKTPHQEMRAVNIRLCLVVNQCPKCKKKYLLHDEKFEQIDRFDFCPFCGKKYEWALWEKEIKEKCKTLLEASNDRK